MQEASQPFELHCVITAGTILMTVYPHGCSYCREIGVNNMIFQICEHFHRLCGSHLQDPFSLFTLKDTRIYKGIFLTGTHVQWVQLIHKFICEFKLMHTNAERSTAVLLTVCGVCCNCSCPSINSTFVLMLLCSHTLNGGWVGGGVSWSSHDSADIEIQMTSC